MKIPTSCSLCLLLSLAVWVSCVDGERAADGGLSADAALEAPGSDAGGDAMPIDAGDSGPLTVYLKRPAGWEAPHLHYFASEPDREATEWPGVAMNAIGGDWYRVRLPQGQRSAGLVFNDRGGAQTNDLSRGRDGWFVPRGVDHAGRVIGRWYDENPDEHPQLEADPAAGGFYGETLSVVLRATGSALAAARYTIDGSDPAAGESFSPGQTITFGGSASVGDVVELRVYAKNTHGEAERSFTFVKRAPVAIEAWDPTDRPASVKVDGRYQRLVGFNNDQGLVARDVTVYLPADYQQSTRRYPVIYFHDGQNLFDAAEATFGAEWMVDEYHDALVVEGLIQPAIIVGVFNGGADRAREYAGLPGDDRRPAYTKWLIHSLKPYIDHHYRTRPQAEFTTTMGSSFGGIISIYQSWNHPEVFGQAGCVSNSFRENGAALLDTIDAYSGPKKPVRFWIDGGYEEGEKYPTGLSWFIANNRRLAERLAALGWREGDDLGYYEAVGEGHDESAWSRRIRKILYFLLRERAPAPIRIEARATLPSLGVGASAFAAVDLYYENDFSLTKVWADSSAAARLVSSAPPVLTVDPTTGALAAKAAGSATIEAGYLSFADAVALSVHPAAPAKP